MIQVILLKQFSYNEVLLLCQWIQNVLKNDVPKN
jgi:hypothetical protein